MSGENVARGSPAFWDRRYARDELTFGERPNAFLAEHAASLVPDGLALVPGDGEGRNGVWLAERGMRVDTVDYSTRGVEKARALAQRRGVAINALQADLLAWEWPIAHYDLVALLFLHLPAAGRRQVHAAAAAALAPGGTLLLQGFTPEQLGRGTGGPPDRDMMFTPALLLGDFPSLGVAHVRERVVELDEGSSHRGAAAVIEFVAQRTA